MVKGHTFDPTDVRVYEFFIQGTPNPKDLEGVEEVQLLEVQRNIQDKLNYLMVANLKWQSNITRDSTSI